MSFLSFLFFVTFIIIPSQSGYEKPKPPVSQIQEKYKVNSKDNLLKQEHLYVKSPLVSVQCLTAVMGFGSVIAPPYFCYPFSANLTLFGNTADIKDYDWYPSCFIQYGNPVNGILPIMKIVPLADYKGVLVELELKNNTKNEVSVPVEWIIEGKKGASINWEWYPPAAMYGKTIGDNISKRKSEYLYTGDSVWICMKNSDIQGKTNDLAQAGNIELSGGQIVKSFFAFLVGSNELLVRKETDTILDSPVESARHATGKTDELLGKYESNVPHPVGFFEDYNMFFHRGLVTLATCKWEVPEFKLNPWYAESGLDGGALNNYCWGLAYISRLLSIIDPQAVRSLLLTYVNADMFKTYAINPSDGKGMGVLYSYNYYSIVRATYDYVTITGDYSLLLEKTGHTDYLDYLFHFCLFQEDLTKIPELIDFGDNHNMLELKRTQDYTRYTPSPNAERLLIYDYLMNLYNIAGRTLTCDLQERKNQLKKIIQNHLWDKEKQWMYCLGINGEKKTAYSIQIFDVLRTGALTREQSDGILSHLNEKEFLSPDGLHSLSLIDEGYDKNDVDWGGPGVYAGDAPELVEDLLSCGYISEGIDLLQRILWWGRFPYIPQAIRADKKGYREDGRPNVITGLVASQCMIFGLFGIVIEPDSISISPVNHPIMRNTGLKGLIIRGIHLNITVSADGTNFTINKAGKSSTYSTGEIAKIRF